MHVQRNLQHAISNHANRPNPNTLNTNSSGPPIKQTGDAYLFLEDVVVLCLAGMFLHFLPNSRDLSGFGM